MEGNSISFISGKKVRAWGTGHRAQGSVLRAQSTGHRAEGAGQGGMAQGTGHEA
jgi:hypothetical protein